MIEQRWLIIKYLFKACYISQDLCGLKKIINIKKKRERGAVKLCGAPQKKEWHSRSSSEISKRYSFNLWIYVSCELLYSDHKVYQLAIVSFYCLTKSPEPSYSKRVLLIPFNTRRPKNVLSHVHKFAAQ